MLGTGKSSVKPHSLLNSAPETNSCSQNIHPREVCSVWFAGFLMYYYRSSNVNAVISLQNWLYGRISIHILSKVLL